MPLCPRSLLEITLPDEEREVVRVVQVDHGLDLAYVVRIDRVNLAVDKHRHLQRAMLVNERY